MEAERDDSIPHDGNEQDALVAQEMTSSTPNPPSSPPNPPSHAPDVPNHQNQATRSVSMTEHSRNQESFSRSRHPPDAALESTGSEVRHANDGIPWPSSDRPRSSLGHASVINADDMEADHRPRMDEDSKKGNTEADSARQELDAWSERNANPAAAPIDSTFLPEPEDRNMTGQPERTAFGTETLSAIEISAGNSIERLEPKQDQAPEEVAQNPEIPFSPKPEDDVWAQTLGLGDPSPSSQMLLQSAAETMPFADPPIVADGTADQEVESGNEIMEELQEGLLTTASEQTSPVFPDDAGFLGAAKEVSGDLELSTLPETVQATEDPLEEAGSKHSGAPADEAEDTSQTLDDTWAKELSGPAQASEEAFWESAFGDALDDDGFLDDGEGFLDEDVGTTNSAAPATTPGLIQSSQPDQVLASYSAPNPMSSTQAPAPLQLMPTDAPRSSSGGMKFFEDLPMTQPARAKKPRQLVPNVQLTATAPPPSSRGFSPPAQSQQQPPSSNSASYPHLVGPRKLEMFPPQPPQPPSMPSDMPILPLQPPVTTNTRYSPAPSQPVPTSTRYANVPPTMPPQPPSRYSPSQPRPQNFIQPPSASQNRTSSTPSQYAAQPPSLQSSRQASMSPPHQVQVPPQTTSRYSPAPLPKTNSSYAPSGYLPNSSHAQPSEESQAQAAPLPPPPPQRFIPRTSSPLRPTARPGVDRSHTVAAPSTAISESEPPFQHVVPGRAPNMLRSTIQAGPSVQDLPTQSSTSLPAKHTDPVPPLQRPPVTKDAPPRPFTQSPEASRFASEHMDLNRKFSLQDPHSAFRSSGPTAPVPFTTSGPSSSDNVNYVQPADPMQATDALSRWKGSPSVHWCPGGSVTTYFPKHVPRFGGGQSAPAMKCSPGEIKLHKNKEAMPADESLHSFPGPLKSKGKKKELLVWLSNRIDSLQRELSTTQMTLMDSRASERLLLWQVIRVLVEHDGLLGGNPSVDLAVRQLFSNASEYTEAPAAISDPAISGAILRDPAVVHQIHSQLLQGEREKAVWAAVDNKQWGHAMLISSTLDGTLWKQVAQEFVRLELRGSGHASKSLAALYAIFAHNWDESVDELVPASARAGFQMVPAAGAPAQSANTLDGLNSWQETLRLVLGNRSAEDENGLVALGKLLRGYGRVEAAHICFLFARPVAQFGGIDDPSADLTLLGIDVGAEAFNDTDAILLSETYEYSTSLTGSSASHYMPHLQAHKLQHAHALADAGHRSRAMQYCDAISAAIKSTTKPSPYYHLVLINQLDDLTKRLSQSPRDGSSSWMSKPTMGKVSSGMWAKFNNFVAGDDDTASSVSRQPSETEPGPFSRFSGGTPTISRNQSFADISTFVPAAPTTGNSRYAPSYTSQAPMPSTIQQPMMTPRDVPRPTSSSHSEFRNPQRSDSYHPPQTPYHASPRSSHYLGISDNTSQTSSSYDPPLLQPHTGITPDNAYGSPPETHSNSRAASSHGAPSLPSQDHEMASIDEEGPSPKTNSHQPTMNGYITSNDTYNSLYQHQDQPASGGGYEPPSGGGYQPYEPTSPTLPTSPDRTKPKKKSFMDDDDDGLRYTVGAGNNSGPGASGAAAQTREPDDAVRKAAEADAARDKAAAEAKKSGSWFPTLGLFGRGNKDTNAPVVHKAKLGEESSFYFDPQTRKWVNKKAGAAADSTTAAATPPPPRAGPPMSGSSRAPSGTGTPNADSGLENNGAATGPVRVPSAPGGTPPTTSPAMNIPGLGISHTSASDAAFGGPPSRIATPGSDAGPTIANVQPVNNAGGLQPPSRPPTSMSNASSIDDLIGAPGGRKGGTVKKGKKGGGRYVDVMAK